MTRDGAAVLCLPRGDPPLSSWAAVVAQIEGVSVSTFSRFETSTRKTVWTKAHDRGSPREAFCWSFVRRFGVKKGHLYFRRIFLRVTNLEDLSDRVHVGQS